MAKCEFCKGSGRRYRPWGNTECPACEGTGQRPLPNVESWREQRLRLRREADAREEAAALETTRAADEGGPEREHGDRDKVEGDSHPAPAPATVPTTTDSTSTRKEQ